MGLSVEVRTGATVTSSTVTVICISVGNLVSGLREGDRLCHSREDDWDADGLFAETL